MSSSWLPIHSLTSFMFEGKAVTKGWLECLVIGDTRTGKSETATAMAKHYGAGIVKPLEGRSVFVATADGGAAYNANAGQITTAGAPRQVQFGARRQGGHHPSLREPAGQGGRARRGQATALHGRPFSHAILCRTSSSSGSAAIASGASPASELCARAA